MIKRRFQRCRRRDRQAFLRQFAHQVGKALPLLAKQIADGDTNVREEQLGGICCIPSDLLQLASATEARAIRLDQAHALGAGIRIGLADHNDDVGVQLVADKGLAAVDDVLIALPDSCGTGILLRDRMLIAFGPETSPMPTKEDHPCRVGEL